MLNLGKVLSGIAAVAIYFLLLLIVLYHYNIHNQKSKNYVEKNSNRITVTLVNSDKSVLNRSDKINLPKRSVIESPPLPPKKDLIAKERKREEQERQQMVAKKRAESKKREERKRLANKKRQERLAKEREKKRLARIAEEKKRKEQAHRVAEARKKEELKKKKEAEEKRRKERLAREREKKRQERLAKEKEKKRLERLAKEREKKRQERLARERRRRERGKDLFASVNTKSPISHQRESLSRSHIKHNSSVVDRIKNTHQSGTISNRNREKGVEDAYKAKVQRRLNNWNAQSSYKGHFAKIKLTISSSGHFRYTITQSSSVEMRRGLREFLDQLNRIGLGRHSRSRPYVFSVTFRAR
jgi:TolA protein